MWSLNKSIEQSNHHVNILNKLQSYGEFSKKFNLSGECIRVRLKVIDSQNCKGPQTELLIPIPKHDPINDSVCRFHITKP
jgi:hypothetical protein